MLTTPSPDGAAKVYVHESCGIADCEVTIYLKSGWLGFSKVIAQRSDCMINFAHVAWSPDSRTVGVYSDHVFCRNIQEGFDLKANAPVPFDTVAHMIRRSIIREYKLTASDLAPYKNDPLLWGHYGEDGIASGVTVFREKYLHR